MKKPIINFLLIASVFIFCNCDRKIPGCTDPTSTNFNPEANEDDGTCKYIAIGENYLGGTIAYIFQQGDPGYDPNVKHGLIAAPYDQSTGSPWGCNGTDIPGTSGIAIGTGNQNTINIINGCTEPEIAAKVCSDLVLNGYDDWYLPSKNELNKLYINRNLIGGFDPARYWSSTQGTWAVRAAWLQDFSNGAQSDDPQYYSEKWVPNYVRAIRVF